MILTREQVNSLRGDIKHGRGIRASDAQDLIETLDNVMKAIDTAPAKWFKVDSNGGITYQTTPKGYGNKALCKVVLMEISPNICPCCGLPKVIEKARDNDDRA